MVTLVYRFDISFCSVSPRTRTRPPRLRLVLHEEVRPSGVLVFPPEEVAHLLVLELLRRALVVLLALAKDVLLHPVDRCDAYEHARARARTIQAHTCRACPPWSRSRRLRPPLRSPSRAVSSQVQGVVCVRYLVPQAAKPPLRLAVVVARRIGHRGGRVVCSAFFAHGGICSVCGGRSRASLSLPRLVRRMRMPRRGLARGAAVPWSCLWWA